MLWCDWDSMCSMPTTFDVSARSKFVTMRLSISSGDSPLYCQTMLTTGMSMYGKDVDRHRRDRDAAQNGDQHGHHDERVGAPEREPDDPHALVPILPNRQALTIVASGSKANRSEGWGQAPVNRDAIPFAGWLRFTGHWSEVRRGLSMPGCRLESRGDAE